jgi:hypothetical protein
MEAACFFFQYEHLTLWKSENIQMLTGTKHILDWICYPGDAVLIEERENNLQRILHQFMLSRQKYDTNISVRKHRPKQQTTITTQITDTR